MQQHRLALESGELAWYEWGARDFSESAFSLLLLHATGFHAQCWRQVIARLPSDQHVICADLRGHGQSSKELHNDWREFSDDIIELIEHLDLERIVGVGHSLGGYATLTTVAMRPERFSGAILLDPVILAPSIYEYLLLHGSDPSEHYTSRRRNQWRDWHEMFEAFRSRHPFTLWDERVLRDYCEFGLRPRNGAGEAGYELSCPPILEASIYVKSGSRSPLGLLDSIGAPIWVVRGLERDWDEAKRTTIIDLSSSPTWPELANHLTNGRDIHWPELTHYLPMQAPARVAELIQEFLRDL